MANWFTHEDRKMLLGIDEETFRLVAEAAPLLRENVDRIVGAFYDRMDGIPGLGDLVGTHSDRSRLEVTLRQYILDMATTRLDESRIAAREVIAGVHDRIGLPIDAYTAQVQAIREVWTDIVLEATVAPKPRLALSRAAANIHALDKLLAFDEGVVCVTFMNTRQDRVEHALSVVTEAQESRRIAQVEVNHLAGQPAAAAEEVKRVADGMAIDPANRAGTARYPPQRHTRKRAPRHDGALLVVPGPGERRATGQRSGRCGAGRGTCPPCAETVPRTVPRRECALGQSGSFQDVRGVGPIGRRLRVQLAAAPASNWTSPTRPGWRATNRLPEQGKGARRSDVVARGRRGSVGWGAHAATAVGGFPAGPA